VDASVDKAQRAVREFSREIVVVRGNEKTAPFPGEGP
jgi:hypothetical protein